jgi:hypothetical protein
MNTSCPYCNSAVPLPAEPPESRRLICPRCGEAFPLPAELSPSLNGTPVAVVNAPAVPSSVNRRSRNRRLGLMIVGGMLLLAAVVAVALVFTRPKRGLSTLAELPTLGYIPDDTNLIAAINVPTADETPEGHAMLDQLGFAQGGTLDLERLVGLPRDEIEDAVVGLKFDQAHPIPRIVVAVRTKNAYDQAALRAKLGGKKDSKDKANRDYVVIQPPGMPLEGAFWGPTPRTLVVCFPEKDFEKVPAHPAENVDRFDPALAALLRSRSERGTFFWLVAHADDWRKTGVQLPLILLMKMKADDLNLIFQARTISLGMRIDTGTITTRSRPARITEQPVPEGRRVALDMFFETAPDADMAQMSDALDAWILKQKLMPHDASWKDHTYTGIVSGTPEDWGRALRSLRK